MILAILALGFFAFVVYGLCRGISQQGTKSKLKTTRRTNRSSQRRLASRLSP